MAIEYLRSPVGILKIVSDGKAVTEISICNAAEACKSDAVTSAAAKQITEYFDGKRTEFTFDINAGGTDFQKKVWSVLRTIPFGKTYSYGEVAEKAGNKKACRAVGNAVGRNPVLIAIPCHRVTAAKGIGGFSAGIKVKKILMKTENIKF